jgi:hypothetical protein
VHTGIGGVKQKNAGSKLLNAARTRDVYASCGGTANLDVDTGSGSVARANNRVAIERKRNVAGSDFYPIGRTRPQIRGETVFARGPNDIPAGVDQCVCPRLRAY